MVRPLLLSAIVLALFPASAAAEWHFTPLVGYTFKGGTNIIDTERQRETGEGAVGKTHKHFGGAVSIFGEGILGIEAVAVWTPSLFQGKPDEIVLETVDQDQSLSLMGNVVLTTPRKWTEYFLRPYFSGGIGLMHASVTQIASTGGDVLDPVNLDAIGYNLGGGAIGFFTERTGVRFDFRYHSTFRRSDDSPAVVDGDVAHLRYMTFSVGVVIRRR